MSSEGLPHTASGGRPVTAVMYAARAPAPGINLTGRVGARVDAHCLQRQMRARVMQRTRVALARLPSLARTRIRMCTHRPPGSASQLSAFVRI